ncbi:DUF4326 domain-containing protein [Nocardia pseudovaccinii]|uniref:DUF4326 domain-containing protein n=1 Tax=Nocardia pseudovaccinii TaxID=189540 RepID=UPI0007A4165E|nr:DUF4326 domain-containing protein [Nocardia pseudovaccinii]
MPHLPPPTDPAHLTITELHQTLATGHAVVVSMRASAGHAHLIAWARRHRLFVPIDRTSVWGNPYIIGRDGNRDDVIRAHARHLTDRPDLLARLRRGELAHRILGCWCAPQPCHGHTLAALTLDPGHDPLAAPQTRPPRRA